MSGIQPVAVYAMRIPPGDIMVPAVPEFAAMFRVTMAAIDPSAEPDLEDADDQRPPRATLKVIRFPDDDDDESDDEDYLDDDDDDDEEDSDEEENGGPSDKQLKRQILLEALAADEDEDDDMEDDEDDEEDEIAAAAKAIKKLTQTSRSKGKGKALDDEDDSEEDDDESEEDLGIDEVVLCTLDPESHYNQPLDFVVNQGEKIFFKVSGTHTVHLTGNFVMPIDDGQASLYDDEDEEDDYDLSPDEDELDALEDEEEESDELDDIDDPRITEVASDEEEAPKLVAAKKGKNKRSAADLDAEEDLDALVAKSIKKDEAPVNGEPKKLSKAEKKAAKKLKKNDGEAVAAGTPEKKTEATVNGSEKKTVQFAKNLEQGPTPSAAPPASKKDTFKKEEDKKTATGGASLGVRNVNGVTVDDRKAGSGPAAKKNSKVEMRYIGKLENGKVFDSNKSGKPFSFKLGTGEVIKGWDIGLEGISAGGERRITIPANLAYGNKQLPGIPKNSKLIFDVKCLSVK